MLVGVKPATPAGNKFAAIKITAMPGQHVPPGPIAAANNLLGAVFSIYPVFCYRRAYIVVQGPSDKRLDGRIRIHGQSERRR